MPNEGNLIPGAGGGRPDQAANPPALRSGWRTRRPAPELLEPYRQHIEGDLLLIGELETSLALQDLIVDRLISFLEENGWTHRGKMRPEVEHLGKAIDRRARLASQLRKARLDQAVAQRHGLVDVVTALASIEEGEEGGDG